MMDDITMSRKLMDNLVTRICKSIGVISATASQAGEEDHARIIDAYMRLLKANEQIQIALHKIKED